MKSRIALFTLVALAGWILGGTVSVAAPIGTAFTYQGRFDVSGSPASGAYDFEFKLFDAATEGTQVGSAVLKNDLSVSDGYFTTTLDFGSGRFTGDARWLQIAVRPGAETGAYTTLTPRHELTPTPYAINSDNEGTVDYIPKFTANGITNSVLYESSGKIGIGTTDPKTKMHIRQPAGGQGIVDLLTLDPYPTDGNGAAIRFVTSADGLSGLSIAGVRDAAGAYGSLRFHTRGIDGERERMRIDQNGNVAIGTTSPGAELDIRETGADDAVRLDLRTQDNPSVYYARFEAKYNAADSFNIYATSGHNLMKYIANNNVLAFNHGGNVGIGTISPTCDLDVQGGQDSMVRTYGSGSPTFMATSTTNNLQTKLQSAGGIPIGVVGTESNHLFAIITGGAGRMFFDTAGNVGIGTASPLAALDVIGNVRCVDLVETSDEQLKANVQPLTGVLDKLGQIRAVSFEWNEKARCVGAQAGEKQIGVLAQEVERVFPEMVTTPNPVTVEELSKGYSEEMLTPEVRQRLQRNADATHYKAVSYSKLSVVLLEAVKELKAENDALRTQNSSLEERLARVEGLIQQTATK